MAISRFEAATPVLASLVTVYLTGTQIAAAIYADALLTPLGNPFTSDALSGLYVFYADDADAYDILLGTTGVPTPPTPSTSAVAFAQMAVVGGAAVTADQPADAMGFEAGAGITLTATPATKRILVEATGGGGSGLDQLTGDVTAGPGVGSQVATLANTAVVAGTYGDATHVARVVIDAKGRITGVTEVVIAGGGGGGSGTVTNTGVLTANRLILGNGGVDVTVLGSLGTVNQVLHGNAAGAPSFSAVANADLSTMAAGTLKANLAGGAATPTDATLAAVAAALGVVAAPIANASLATMPTGTVKGNSTGGAAVPTDLTYTQLATAMNLLQVPVVTDTVVPLGTAILELEVVATPSAPAASTGLLYFDTSGGKVRLMVLFPSGGAQLVKAEP